MLKSINKWQLMFFISLFVIVVLVISIILLIANNGKFNKKQIDKDDSSYRDIRIDEDIFAHENIENLENVMWDNARITQDNSRIEVSLNIRNESEEKVESKTLTVKLLDEDGKIIAEKDIEMGEIEGNFGYKDLDLEFETNEIKFVYDIKVVAK